MDLDDHCIPTPSTSNAALLQNNNLGLDESFVTTVAEQLGFELPIGSGQQVSDEISDHLRKIFKLARRFHKCSRRRWMNGEDLEVAMAFYGHSTLMTNCASTDISLKHIGKQGRDIFVCDEQELEISSFLSSTSGKLPLEATLKAHWLVINGTQPAVPENPLPPPPPEICLSDENTQKQLLINGSSTGIGGLFLNQAAKSIRKTEQVQLKSTITHSLSLEALNCLQMDCGLRSLLPRFCIAITEGVRCNIVVHNMAILVYLMRMIQALSQNAALSLEPCLHELLPAMMSCILSRQLSSNQHTSETHCVLREFSADLLAQLLRHYRLPHIHTRVIRALSRAFTNQNTSLPTLYGATFAICELGADVILRILLPNLGTICETIQRVHSDKLYINDRSLAQRLYNKLVEKLSVFARDQNCILQLHTLADYRDNFLALAEDIYKLCKNNNNNNI
ncbi:TAF domain-containing protein [Meloidogyne graminicola]|uniref:TAF domain-containing protein n=1 Tax=Meloidogyne graminicola TaxID=189291 RepID=A0A8S9ZIK4_9BILA|nr:TAF domain-containing protein [Meloidogyne graminicola]